MGGGLNPRKNKEKKKCFVDAQEDDVCHWLAAFLSERPYDVVSTSLSPLFLLFHIEERFLHWSQYLNFPHDLK